MTSGEVILLIGCDIIWNMRGYTNNGNKLATADQVKHYPAIIKKNYKTLTMKQASFLREYFKTGNGVKSAMKAYNLPPEKYEVGCQIAFENLRKHEGIVRHMAESRGLTIPSLIKTLKQQLKSTRPHSSPTEPDREVPDNQARLKAVEIASRWIYKEKPENLAVSENKTLNIVYNNWGK